MQPPTPSQNATPELTTDAAPPSADQVAMRAYLKWLDRGCPMGDDKRDWFEAEEEVKRETEPA